MTMHAKLSGNDLYAEAQTVESDVSYATAAVNDDEKL